MINQNIPSDFHVKINDLISYGEKKIRENNLTIEKAPGVVLKGKCTGYNLHRGIKHPSPIFDIVIGNIKRGKLVGLTAPNTDPTCYYYSDYQGKMQYIETVFQGRTDILEHLFYEDNRIIGVSIDRYGTLCAVSEEIYEGNFLRNFCLLDCYLSETGYSCFSFRMEHYYYESLELSECEFTIFSPKSKHVIKRHYIFERENGLLTTYMNVSESAQCPVKYMIRKKRKAKIGFSPFGEQNSTKPYEASIE